MNLLRNGDFSGGWSTNPTTGNQTPNGWALIINHVDSLLSNIEPRGAGDTEDHVQVIPECVHKLSAQLPENEQLGGPDALILEGDAVYKIFHEGGAFCVELVQIIEGLEPGRRVQCKAHVNTSSYNNADTGGAYWRFSVNGEYSKWLTYKTHFENKQWLPYTILTRVDNIGWVNFSLEFESHTVGNSDFFIDALSVEYIDDEPAPPDPEPGECRGLPRVDYERTYNVIHESTDLDGILDIVEATYPQRQTVGFSTDDAGIGDLSIKNARLWNWPDSERQIMLDWYATYYPGVIVTFESLDSGGPVIPPVIPEPPEPPGEALDGGPQYTLPSDNLIGLHCQEPKKDWPVYVRDAKPTIFKTVGQLGMIIEARQAFPDVMTVYRHILDDGMYNLDDKPARAREALDVYSRHLEAHAQATGMSVYEVLDYVDVIESVNEVISTFNPSIFAAVEFDIAFCDAVRERYGDAVSAGILTAPIGNPHESEVIHLLPAARKAYEDGHWLAPHPYWSGDEHQSYILTHWEHHAGRWMEWDKVFREYGVYPRYYGGEAGVTWSPDGGHSFHSGKSWKSCGPFSEYLVDMQTFDAKCHTWNAQHGNRFAGAVIFCYGAQGWDEFQWEPGDLYLMTEVLA
jgi:hypothetical protein